MGAGNEQVARCARLNFDSPALRAERGLAPQWQSNGLKDGEEDGVKDGGFGPYGYARPITQSQCAWNACDEFVGNGDLEKERERITPLNNVAFQGVTRFVQVWSRLFVGFFTLDLRCKMAATSVTDGFKLMTADTALRFSCNWRSDSFNWRI